MPAVSNIVTKGKGTGTKNVLKGTTSLVVFNARSSVYDAVRYVDNDNLYIILVINTIMQ